MQSIGFAGRCNEHDARTYFDWQRTMHLLFFENITFLVDSCTYSNPESPLFLSVGKYVVAQEFELQIARMCKSMHFRKHGASTRVLCPIQVTRWLTMGSVGPVDTTSSFECRGQKYLVSVSSQKSQQKPNANRRSYL